MNTNIKTILYLYCILTMPIFSVYPLSQSNFTTPLVDQYNDSVIVVSKMRYCRTDFYAIVDYTSSVQDVTATDKTPHTPFPPEPSHNNETIISENNHCGNGFKKVGTFIRNKHQFIHNSLTDSRQYADSLTFLFSTPRHLKSTVLQI